MGVCLTASYTNASGSMGQYISKMNKSPAKWINDSTWKECLQLSSSISAFAGLCSNIAVNGAFWSKFSSSENPFIFLEHDHRDTKDLSTVIEGMKPGNIYLSIIKRSVQLCYKKSPSRQFSVVYCYVIRIWDLFFR